MASVTLQFPELAAEQLRTTRFHLQVHFGQYLGSKLVAELQPNLRLELSPLGGVGEFGMNAPSDSIS